MAMLEGVHDLTLPSSTRPPRPGSRWSTTAPSTPRPARPRWSATWPGPTSGARARAARRCAWPSPPRAPHPAPQRRHRLARRPSASRSRRATARSAGSVRYASWDLTHVISSMNAPEPCSPALSSRQGRQRRRRGGARSPANCSQRRKPRPARRSGMAPLLRQHMAEYAATGLPPAYLPKDNPTPSLDPDTNHQEEIL